MINFKAITQSGWLGDLLNQYFPNQGTFVEIGVGNIISYNYFHEREKFLGKAWNELPIICSNTIELLQNGWTGFYIDPEESFIAQALLLAPDKSKIKTKVVGCGNKEETRKMGDGESFKSSTYVHSGSGWVGRDFKIMKTRDVFLELGVPNNFEFMSIDVEGYELEVLDGFDLKEHSPKAIMIETNHTPKDQIYKKLTDYSVIQEDNLNSFLLKK